LINFYKRKLVLRVNYAAVAVMIHEDQ